MESLINKQEDIYSRIDKAYVNFKKSPKERITRPYCKVRLENLEKLWDQLENGHSKLYEGYEPDKLKQSRYVKNDVYELADEVYIQYKTELETVLESFDIKEQDLKENSKVSSSKQCQVKLPKIIIPVFSGKYTDWVTFRDLFLSLIHNNKSLDNVQRMQYLKGYLSGEAEQLLRQIPISDANYDRCWELLNARYNNKRYLSHFIIKRLLSQKNLNNESAVGLKELLDNTNDCLKALSNLGINVESWDIIVIHIITLKLDPESRKEWEFNITKHNSSEELPTFIQFAEFLTNRYRALEFLDGKSNSGSKGQSHQNSNSNTNKISSLHVADIQCSLCAEPHRLSNCKQFVQKLDCDARRSFVLEKGICFNCLGNNHSAKVCNSKVKCRICKRSHHSLLHPSNGFSSTGPNINRQANAETLANNENIPTKENMDSPISKEDREGNQSVTCFSTGKLRNTVLLATALIRAESKAGTYQVVRALIDQGSQVSLVTEATVQFLGLKKTPSTHIIKGVGGDKEITSRSVVTLNLRSRIDSHFYIQVQAYVLKSITTVLPVTKVTTVEWVELQEESLADPQYHTPNKINVLLGADVYTQIIEEGLKKNVDGSVVAQCSKFGWILSGIVDTSAGVSSNVVVMHCHINEELKKFWELEAEPTNQKRLLTEEEKQCEGLFSATTTRDEEGRYVVRLPFREQTSTYQVGGFEEIAEKRLNALHTKLKKNTDLKEKYKQVIKEYLQLGHMEKVPEKEKKKGNSIYLPHHAVVRDDKDTTKVRVVFDASCKGKKGYSLNDKLMIGPRLQPELRHLLLRWRKHPICLAADIVKMYRQVKVATVDNDYQRILWKEEPEDVVEHYRMLRVTFGTASAPYLAVRALQQVAHDNGGDYPSAAERVINDFYMDDLLTGCNNTEEGLIIYKEMNSLLSKAGFELQKWMCNNENLLNKIKEMNEGQGEIGEGLQLKEDEIVKLLGLTWNRRSDDFQYSVTLSREPGPVTKRKIISHIAKLYDPLGWVAPSVIIAKILIQKLWIAGLDWDEEVTTKMLIEWNTYLDGLSLLSQVKIPRWLGTKSDDTLVELHGFSDASKAAYAAAVYIRVIDADGNIRVTLVTAKTKVAPIKQVSIPRLELCGAVMVTKLLVEVARVMGIDISNVRAWTDSTVVLAWLNSHPNRWKTFVANRVSEILTTLDSTQWSHVSSGQNPADLGSRGIYPSELCKCSFWFNGPAFLSEAEIPYSKPKQLETDLEVAKVNFTVTEDSIWDRYSSFTKLIRVVAYCRRFLKVTGKRKQFSSYLLQEELNDARKCAIRNCQAEGFKEEIAFIRKQGHLTKLKGPLKPLTPYLDEENILRVGGRLEKSQLSLNAKHPILIPKRSKLTDLLIADAHIKTLHGGTQLMLTYLSTEYYIIGGKSVIKGYVRKCIPCVKGAAKTSQQLMGQLPEARASPSRPFKCSGVDYAGPIKIRTTKGRGHHAHKGYICLFICMATRAVHIEVVSDLTTQGFLAAFKRFVARRGLCTDIWSDNGTNFVGASKKLQNLFASERSIYLKEISETLATNGTRWHLIPPHAPNYGGLWEAGVKSVKFHLKRVIGDSTLTYEELSTVLVQIESCLNSRPLSTLNTDSDALDVLTPGHFLIGEPLVAVPDHNFETFNVSNLRRWQLTQRMMQEFWRRWSHEYLTKFLHRYKWTCQNPEPNIGDVVVVKEDDLPPGKWLLARVVEKHPGLDKITRVVTLRTQRALIKRPTSKLCILPVTQ